MQVSFCLGLSEKFIFLSVRVISQTNYEVFYTCVLQLSVKFSLLAFHNWSLLASSSNTVEDLLLSGWVLRSMQTHPFYPVWDPQFT